MFAVGVDVSNGRSMVAVLQSKQKLVMKPFEVQHTSEGFAALAEKLDGLGGETRIVMEHTGRYYESFALSMHQAGFFVSAVNPLLIKNYQDGITVRKVKTDKADAVKLPVLLLTNGSFCRNILPWIRFAMISRLCIGSIKCRARPRPH